ncbi:CRISP/Allergen/PR-1-like [Alosa sapidissima]|uniref:CRISP/Allergen/PR-1-like n=1 Tax=Alosa sapidissima TaxID=34773 RepID=UPI001C09DC41|nr:CRISP/Allergen/PR-1-like [Alosa sapidissima]
MFTTPHPEGYPQFGDTGVNLTKHSNLGVAKDTRMARNKEAATSSRWQSRNARGQKPCQSAESLCGLIEGTAPLLLCPHHPGQITAALLLLSMTVPNADPFYEILLQRQESFMGNRVSRPLILMTVPSGCQNFYLPHNYLQRPDRCGKQTKNTMADARFKTEFLQTHNELRAKHGMLALTMSDALCNSAQAWADHLESINKNSSMMTLQPGFQPCLQHSDTKNGENLYFSSSSAPIKLTGKEAVENWYSEIKDYDFSNPGFGSNTGHFTQVVWKSSTEVGVGIAMVGNAVFVVGQYSPAGNISNEGYFEKNVLPAA